MKKVDLFGIAFMLFAIFFGAGNMIFPPQLSSMAGKNYLISLLGFIASDIGLSVLGVIVVAKAGDNLDSILNIISPKFAIFFTLVLYLMIGPLFAIPRTGAVTYEFIIADDNISLFYRMLILAAFFSLVYILSINPNNIVTIVGKILTPILIISIITIFIAVTINTENIVLAPAQKGYQKLPFIAGIEQGYLAMDGLAAVIFSTIVINSIKKKEITDKKQITKIVIKTALLAGLILAFVYYMLASIGSKSTQHQYFSNGAELLIFMTDKYIGTFGRVVLSLSVSLACLTTAIGLTTSMGSYLEKLNPKLNYKITTLIIVLFSFTISMFGLNEILKVSIPILIALYPLVILIIFLGFFKDKLQDKPLVFILALVFASIVSITQGFEKAGVNIYLITNLAKKLPLYSKDFGYLLPSIIGMIIGYIIEMIKKRRKA